MGWSDVHQFYLSGHNGVTEKIQRTINDVANSFCYIGFLLYECRENEYYKEKNYKSVVEYAEKELGFKKSTTYNFISVCERFSQRMYNRPSMQLDPKFRVFSFRKLVQMCSIKNLDILEQITPDHTVKEIIEIKKNSTRVEKNVSSKVPESPISGQMQVDDKSNIVEVNFEQVVSDPASAVKDFSTTIQFVYDEKVMLLKALDYRISFINTLLCDNDYLNSYPSEKLNLDLESDILLGIKEKLK